MVEGPGMSKKPLIVMVLALLLSAPAPASAAKVKESFEYGYFYGTFGQSPNILLLAGGVAEDFCADNPEDPFNGSPASADAIIKERRDGSASVKVNANGQPIYLYYIEFDDGPTWIAQICADIQAGEDAPEPFASGTAVLKVRDRYVFSGGPPISIYNSVNGTVLGTDGTKYHVRAAADIPTFVDGNPVGSPPEWVSFSLK
jgi:hypothetical protein